GNRDDLGCPSQQPAPIQSGGGAELRDQSALPLRDAEGDPGQKRQCPQQQRTGRDDPDKRSSQLQELHLHGNAHYTASSRLRRFSSSARMRSKNALSRSAPAVSSCPISRPALISSTRSAMRATSRSEEHTSELQSRLELVCRPPLEK